MKEYFIYTDGSCDNRQPKPRSGGWAWLLVSDGKILFEGSGHLNDATSQTCEVVAVKEGLDGLVVLYEHLSGLINLSIVSDSVYVIDCFNEKWYIRWEQMDYQGVKNKDIWQNSIREYRRVKKLFLFPNALVFKIKFVHVNGHSGNKFNDRAHKLANEARLKS